MHRMKLRYDVEGTGPTLVLVHGVVHRRQAWAPVLDLLTPYRRVVTVDLPGHGESDPIDASGPAVLESLLNELNAFVREIEEPGTQVHVAGNSLGGWLALCLAARGEVASATALSPAGFFLNKVDQERTMSTFRGLRAVARRFGTHAPELLKYRAVRYPAMSAFFARPSQVTYRSAVVDTASLTSNALIDAGLDSDFDFPPMTTPAVPVTVAWGRRDLILPVYQARKVTRSFPHAKVMVVPGVGHVPMSDNPELVASILLAGSETAAVPQT